MITIYKDKNDISDDMEYVELNDIFFNQKTILKLDNYAKEIIEKVDGSKLLSKYKIMSKFNEVALDIDCLSTGCKTILNVLYFPNKVFCMKECGDNAIELLYSLKNGNIYSDYAMIPFEMPAVRVANNSKYQIIDDYEELKRWWKNEMLTKSDEEFLNNSYFICNKFCIF